MIIDLRKNGSMPPAEFAIIPTETPAWSVSGTFAGELLLNTESPDTTTPNYICSFSPRNFSDVVIVENSDPAVCSIENFPLIEYIGAGSSTITITVNGLSRQKRLLFTPTSNAYKVFTGYTTNTSIAAVLYNEVLTRLDNDKDVEMFTAYNPASLTNIKNNNCWVANVDLTGNAIATTIRGVGNWTSANSGALLTSQHFVGVSHFNGPNNLAVGCQLRFLDSDGVTHTRTVIGNAGRPPGSSVNSGPDYFNDITIATLNEPLPATVTPFKIVGDWIIERPGGTALRIKGFGFFINQFKRVYTVQFDCINGQYLRIGGDSQFSNITYDSVVYPDIYTMISWKWNWYLKSGSVSSPFFGLDKFLAYAISGDSGGPLFVVVDNKPILVSLFTGPDYGHLYHENAADFLNALIVNADISAQTPTGTAITPGGAGTLTVTVAPDPTL
jgi:hypothetical protein